MYFLQAPTDKLQHCIQSYLHCRLHMTLTANEASAAALYPDPFRILSTYSRSCGLPDWMFPQIVCVKDSAANNAVRSKNQKLWFKILPKDNSKTANKETLLSRHPKDIIKRHPTPLWAPTLTSMGTNFFNNKYLTSKII